MSTLSVSGEGIWVVGLELESDELESIKSAGEIDEDRLEEIRDESMGCGLGFTAEAIVYIDDKPLCTIGELIEVAKSEHLKNALRVKQRQEPFENGWVSERAVRGVFFSEELSSLIKGKKPISDEKIKKAIIENLSVENDCFFSLSDWSDEDNSDLDTKADDEYFLMNGERFYI